MCSATAGAAHDGVCFSSSCRWLAKERGNSVSSRGENGERECPTLSTMSLG